MTSTLTLNNNVFHRSFKDEIEEEENGRRFHSADMYNLDDLPTRSTLAKIGTQSKANDNDASSTRSTTTNNVGVKPTKTRCRKRKQVKRACSNCRKAHSACGKQRPCPRCVLRKEEHKCVDTPRKKRILEGEDGSAYGVTKDTVSSPPPSSDDDETATSTSASVSSSEHSSPIDTGFPIAQAPVRRRSWSKRRPMPSFASQQANIFSTNDNDFASFRTNPHYLAGSRTSLQQSQQFKREAPTSSSSTSYTYTPIDASVVQQHLDVKLPQASFSSLPDYQPSQQQQLPSPDYYAQQQQPSFFFQDELLDQHQPTTSPYQLPQQQQQQQSFSFAPLTSFNDIAYGHNATLQPSLVDDDFQHMASGMGGSWDESAFDDFSSDPDPASTLEREVEQMLGSSDTGRTSLAASLQEFPWL